MCYSISSSLSAQLKRARHYGLTDEIARIEKEIQDWHYANAFNHDNFAIYTNWEPTTPVVAQWGLIPHTKDSYDEAKKMQTFTLNARGETLFDKPSFEESAKFNRCVIYVDGFFEYFHKAGKKFPYFIHAADEQPLALAGMWSEWSVESLNKVIRSFTIITTRANSLMQEIHNKPKAKESRMPVILAEELVEEWLDPSHEEFNGSDLKLFLKPIDARALKAHTVPRLMGNQGVGNTKDAKKEWHYPELNPGLF